MRRYGSKAITRKNAAAALAMMLSAVKPENLETFTAEQLAGCWNVPVGKIAEMLAEARARRSA